MNQSLSCRSRPRGLTVLESLACIAVCLLLLVVAVPVGLTHLGIIKAKDEALTETTGIVRLDRDLKRADTPPSDDTKAKAAKPEAPKAE